MNLQNVLIFGDSYSTFEGYIPEGYESHYGEVRGTGGVHKVSDTWWHKLITETGSHLVRNDSWSGSTICYTWYGGVDCSETSSFIHRLHTLKQEGFFEKETIHTVLVFGGTNDSWTNAPIGELQYADWDKQDLYCVLPAVCYFLHELKDTLPHARIAVMLNYGLKPEIVAGMMEACDHYGIQYIRLSDMDKAERHPTVQGMTEIKDQLKEELML